VQTILAALKYQTERADEAEKQRDGWKKQSDEWRGLYDDETKRSALLKGATVDRKEAFDQTSFAAALLTKQHEEDKGFIREQNDYIRKLETSRFKFAIGGIGLGLGTCAAAVIPSLFR
jgi:hypothetical protein